jgi:hypothetical protein
MEPSEVTITIRTVTAQEWRDLYYFAKDNLNPDDRPLSRANVVDVFHPRLYVRGIKQGTFLLLMYRSQRTRAASIRCCTPSV